MFTPCTTDFPLEQYLVSLLRTCTFFAEISRRVAKVPSGDLATAAVEYDCKNDQLTLYYNPRFLAAQTRHQIRGLIQHEFLHISLGHLTGREMLPVERANLAQDLAINSMIVHGGLRERGRAWGDEYPLPACAVVPGSQPRGIDGVEIPGPLSALIAGLPPLQSAEWYFERLSTNGDSSDYDAYRFDDHGAWRSTPVDAYDRVGDKVRSIVKDAVDRVDQKQNGWGGVPAVICDAVRRALETQVDWRDVFRRFVGTLIRGGRTSSIKRINRRYPYVHPGTVRSRVAKLLVACDESGSVDDAMLATFFAELESLTRLTSIDLLPFDASAEECDIVPWRRGASPELAKLRTKRGGTNFSAPTRVFNDPKNRGRWDALLIVTDGRAAPPCDCRGRRAWLLAAGRVLAFDSDEMQIHMSK